MEKGVTEITDTVFSEKKEEESEEEEVTEITDIVFSEKKEEESEEEEEEEEEEEKKNCGGNGIINSLISNLVAPFSPRVVVKDGGDDSHSSSAEAKNGGVFNTLISGILHPTGSGDEREGAAAGDEREVTAAGDGGGGLLDTAPATDEASILIHSLVHD